MSAKRRAKLYTVIITEEERKLLAKACDLEVCIYESPYKRGLLIDLAKRFRFEYTIKVIGKLDKKLNKLSFFDILKMYFKRSVK